jgi:hypothetical protein
MTNPVENADYRVGRTHDKTESSGVHAGNRAIVDFLQLLGRAARQFHTYPATSPLCTDAIGACHSAFMALGLEQPLSFRVSPREIVLDDDAVGRGTIIEQELSRPLHRAHVASVDIDRAVSVRDWCQFCAILAAGVRVSLSRPAASFAELLLDAGVGAIVPRVTPRPEMFEIGAPPTAVQTLVERERTRQSSLGATSPAQHIYPPDKGWVRVDPVVAYESISLLDLTVLVNDPAELAAMLTRLIDDDTSGPAADGAALEQRYSDVVMLISALDPRLGRLLFSKLARTVLDLDSDRRRSLLRRAILPNLLDGRLDGEAVLGEFPDVDLAEALCLLLDLEAAAPQLLPLALDRLRLGAERRTTVVPLIEARVKARCSTGEAVDRWSAAGLDRQAGALTRVESRAAKNFGDFAAFDLSINEQTAAALASVRDAIVATEGLDAQLTCTLSLVTIEPNPAVAGAVLARGLPALQVLVRDQRWQDLTRWIARLGRIAADLQVSRPDVARAVHDTLLCLCDCAFVIQLAELCGNEPGRTYAVAIVAALGPSIVPAWLAALAAPADRARVRALMSVMFECAQRVAPAIAERLSSLSADPARTAVAVLGFAGTGYETLIAEQGTAADEGRRREAFRALARIGSAKAAALIVAQLEHGPALAQPAAEEALWRLPPSLALIKTRELLGRREFVTRHPHAATRLLERAAQSSDDGFDPVLESLIPLRFHFWSPAVARVGAKARDLLQ